MPNHAYTVEIEAGLDDVWQALSDFGGATWIPKITAAEAATDARDGVGAEQLVEHLILEPHTKRVTSWTEGQRVEFEYDGLPEQIALLTENWWLADEKEATRVTVDQRFDVNLGPASMNLVQFVQAALKEDLVNALAGLKHHVETGEVVTSDFLQVAANELRERYTSAVRAA